MKSKNIFIESTNNNIDNVTLQKMKFIYNGILNGWSVKMTDNKFIFSKKHEGKKEIFSKDYIDNFINTNLQ
jgi:hypothetical protein